MNWDGGHILLIHTDHEVEVEQSLASINGTASVLVTADSVAQGVKKLSDCRLVLLDLSTAGDGALDSLARVSAAADAVPIIALVDGSDTALADAVLTEGARDAITVAELNGLSLLRSIRFALEITRTECELRHVEDQLQQAQKMEAIGLLASGIAHDFNNLLTSVEGYSALILESIPENDVRRSDVEEIHKAAERAGALTDQLLAFSRKNEADPRPMDLNTVMGDMSQMLQRMIGPDVELIVKSDPTAGRVRADVIHVEQVVMNLAVNSRDAMPHGGKLIIDIADVTLDSEHLDQHPEVLPGEFVRLSVTDTGTGMPVSVREHIFEPLYTTKEMGKGTGLGLSTVYAIVKEYSGHIWVYSEPSEGTVFKIYFPRLDALPVTEPEPEPVVQDERVTILVIEDEPGMCLLFKKFIERLGYDCLVAEDGETADRICREHGESIALCLCDVVLRKTRGPIVVRRLLEQQPDMKVLFTSAYTDSSIVEKNLIGTGENFIGKPFTIRQLGEKLRALMPVPA